MQKEARFTVPVSIAVALARGFLLESGRFYSLLLYSYFCNKCLTWFIAAVPSTEPQTPFQKDPLTLPTWLRRVKILVTDSVVEYITVCVYTTSDWVVKWIGKGCGRKCLSPNLMYYNWICLEWLSKTQSSRCSGRRSNRVIARCKSETFLFQARYSVALPWSS